MNLRLPAGYVEGKAAQAQAEARESFQATMVPACASVTATGSETLMVAAPSGTPLAVQSAAPEGPRRCA
jgi:hypothetical protein